MTRNSVLSVAAVATVAVLAACTSSGDGSKTSPSAFSTKAGQSATAPLTQPSSVPTSVPNDPSTRRDARLTSCTSVSGGWRARGTVQNTGGTRKAYTITVFFTTNPGATVQGYGTTRIDVVPGRAGSWSVTRKFKATKDTTCVLRGVG